MREAVVLKGSKEGLRLVFDESADFSVIVEQLRSKLESAANFFTAGTTVKIPSAATMSAEKREELIHLLTGYGLCYRDEVAAPPPKPVVRKERKTAVDAAVTEVEERLVVSRTLRGGQKIVHHGSVLVTGDLNPGAAVIAAGDIVIQGACRGLAHAGAYGDVKATITAGRLMAGQLRIADLIARSPDSAEAPEYPEVARIADGAVIIEPAEVKEGDLWVR